MVALLKRLIFSCMTFCLFIPFSTFPVSETTKPNPAAKNIRKYLTTIRWYPENPDDLRTLVSGLFKHATAKPIPGKIMGLISPHAGLAYSGRCAARGFKQLERVKQVERVILLGVAHRGGFYGAAVSDFQYNSTPLGLIPVDTTVTAKLAKEKLFRKNNEALQQEHSLENQLPFLQYLQQQLKNHSYKIVPVLFSNLEKKDVIRVAQTIKKYVTPRTLIVASTDFTHFGANYGYTPFYKDVKNRLTRLDMGMIHYIKSMDFDGYFDYKRKTGITMCGFTPVGVLMSILKDEKCQGTLTDYYKSGDMANDYSLSVSYASIVISQQQGESEPGKKNSDGLSGKENGADSQPANPNPAEAIVFDNNPLRLTTSEKAVLLALARETLEEHFQGRTLDLQTFTLKQKVTPLMQEQAGVFVTLKKKGHLRGCIGTIVGREPLIEGVRGNALKAALQDPRFKPLTKKELNKIQMEISVMTPLQKIADYKTIRLGTDGVILRKGYHQAVFLPQVASETGWGLEQFLGQLCRKAGLPAEAYRSNEMEFYIFQALVFNEKEISKK